MTNPKTKKRLCANSIYISLFLVVLTIMMMITPLYYITFIISAIAARNNNDIQFGMVFGAGEWSSPYAPYDSQLAVNSLKALKNTGASHVRILVTWYQDNINSTKVYPITNVNSSLVTSTDDQLIHIINTSNNFGFKTVLAPVLDPNWDLQNYQSRAGWCFDTNEQKTIPCKSKNTWRGVIGKYFTEQQWSDWFDSYGQFIIKYAKICQEYNCFMYEAAAELLTAFEREQEWRDLIKNIRSVYNGKLTVAGYDNIQFWDALDYIGLEGYQKLNGFSVEELKNSWVPVVNHWKNLTSFWNKSLIITEVGYQSRPSGYSLGANNPRYDALDCSIDEFICINQTLQAFAYQALFETFIDIEWWEGVYFWLWRTDPWQGKYVFYNVKIQ